VTPTPLSAPAVWSDRHAAASPAYTYPRPRRYLLDCELDLTFSRHLDACRGGHALEIGCGSSVWLPYFATAFGMRVTGVDYTKEGIDSARRVLDANRVTGELVFDDIFTAAPGLQARFDVVFSLGVVEHFAEPAEALTVFAGLVRPGGLLVTWTPNTRGAVVALSCRLNPDLRDFYAPVSLAELVAWQRELRLEVVEARHTQLLDLTLVNLRRLPRYVQVWLMRAARLAALPQLAVARSLRVSPQSPRFSAGLLTVARRPRAPGTTARS
jgi:2-polyprenyl-3-methyl-5-hydroxy-6-metoxy-1,4-benzoquinol methylase